MDATGHTGVAVRAALIGIPKVRMASNWRTVRFGNASWTA
jgi:hypothetical protein